MSIVYALIAAYLAAHPVHSRKPLTALQAVARDYPECVEEYGTDGLSGLDPDELRDACESW